MDSQRNSVKNNYQVFQGEFVRNFILCCFKLMCFVVLRKGTIYIYDSRKNYLNNPQKPRLFFNLCSSDIKRDGKGLTITDSNWSITLWSEKEEEVAGFQQSAKYNKQHLDPQKIFPRKFTELNTRIDEKLQQSKWDKQ